MTDAEINELTMNTLGLWPSFEAQSWACKVVHAVMAAQDFQPDLTTIPDGWWLYGLFHNHTPTKFRGDVHIPFDKSGHGDPWTCKLQSVPGGRLTEGSGMTPRQALQMAVMEVELRNNPAEEER